MLSHRISRRRILLLPAAALLVAAALLLNGVPEAFGSKLAGGSSPAPAAAPMMSPAQAAAPVMGPVFNDPTGAASSPASAKQRAIFDQLINLVNATPAGETIKFAIFEFAITKDPAPEDLANAFINAHRRGVHVRIILDEASRGTPTHEKLAAALGRNDSAGSWIVTCGDQSNTKRGCIAGGYLHTKFAVFSRIQPAGGSSQSKVVFQTSANFNDWYLFQSYNDAVTFADGATYDGYNKYFEDLRKARRNPRNSTTGFYWSGNYFWTTPTGSAYRGHFLPRTNTSGDTIVNVLKLIKCAYKDEGGANRQTDIRIAMLSFRNNRDAIARELRRLAQANCWVNVIYEPTRMDAEPLALLRNHRNIGLVPCRFTEAGRSIVPHTKLMMIDGSYDGSITPRIYTGSANFNHQQSSDDSFVRISGRSIHDRYLSWFYSVRSRCQQG